MSVEISSVQITGITTVVNLTDAVSKEYVDTSSGITTTSDDGNRLFVYSDGSTQSWEPIGAYQEYTSPGTYTFTVPTQAKQLFIEATGAGGGGASANSDDSSFINDGISWITRINTFGNPINTLIYGGGYYVASGGNTIPGTSTGQIRVSADTVTWTFRTSSNINGISASVYKTSADNPNVVGGYGPLEWTQRTSGTTVTIISAIYDGSNFFVGGSSAFLSTSTNAIQWTLRTSGTTFNINSLVFASGQTNSYVYCASGGVLSSSTDGINWTLRTNSSAAVNLNKVIFASGETNPYVVGGASGRLNVSTNAIQWTLRTTGNITNTINSIVYNSSITEKYVIGRSSGQLQTSTNAIQWISRTTGAGAAISINSIIYQNPNFVAGCSSGVIITSTDAIQWTLRTSGFGTTSVGDITYGNGIYIASGSSGICATSTDTITWIQRLSGFGTTIINTIAYGNDIYLNAGGSGLITTSTNQILSTYGQGAYLAVSSDTITWTLRTTGTNTQNITALASNSSFYVAGQQNSISESNIIVSTNSITWVVRTSPFSSTIDSIIYDGNTYFVGGSLTGECVVSTDTIIWTLRTSGFGSGNNSIISVAYGLVGSTPTYVATGYPPAIGGVTILVASTDTIIWTLRTSGLARSGTSLGYNNGIFMLATGSFISTSTDTITWILRTSGFASSGTINAMIYGLSEWSAAGSGSSPTSGSLVAAPNPKGLPGGGGGGGATVSWNISKAYITGPSLTVNVGQGGSAGQAGAASTVSWTGNSGTYTLTANGGIGGTNTYNQSTIIPGGSGASIPSTTSNYLTANAGTAGGRGGLFGSTLPATTGTNATTGFQATGGGGGNYTGGTGVSGGIIYYYNNTSSATSGTNATSISGLSYGNGGGGGAVGSSGGSGVKGGGGGGGGYDSTTDTLGTGGVGGDGYVRISWQ
jgi:hypothetical protein